MINVIKNITGPYRTFLKRWWHNPSLINELHYAYTFQFSQFGEDIFLNQFFRDQKQGFYIDIGAYHPFKYSNTFLFYKKGWRGINIEPNPEGYSELKKYRRRDINLNFAINQEKKEVSFICDGAFSGIDNDSYKFKERNPEAKIITVPSRSLKMILAEFLPSGMNIDFMSIECEGNDINVMLSSDWEKFRPRVLLVEDHENASDSPLDKLLLTYGYFYYCRMGLTKVFIEQTEAPGHLPAARSDGRRS
jgi:FkbM family methyltransferase